MKKVILGIAIGILISSVVAYAGTYLYTADEVGYTTSKNTSVNNVNEAINDLYEKEKNNVPLFSSYEHSGFFSNETTGQRYISIDTGLSNIDISKNWSIIIVPKNKSSRIYVIMHFANQSTIIVMGNGFSTQDLQNTSTPPNNAYSPVVGISGGTMTINTYINGTVGIDTIADIYYGVE